MGLLGQHANSPNLSELFYCRLAGTNNPLTAFAAAWDPGDIGRDNQLAH